MIQACCHFLYPIVLNPWCTSSLYIRGTYADLDSAALPVLELSYHSQTQLGNLYYASCIYQHHCTPALKAPRWLRLVYSVALDICSIALPIYLLSSWQQHHLKGLRVMRIRTLTRLSQDSRAYVHHQE